MFDISLTVLLCAVSCSKTNKYIRITNEILFVKKAEAEMF